MSSKSKAREKYSKPNKTGCYGLMCPPKPYMEALALKVMAFGGGLLGGNVGQTGSHGWGCHDRISVLTRKGKH